MGKKHEEWREVKNGKVEVSLDEFREYVNLRKKRDNELESIRTQMRLQNAQAMRLARAVTSGLIGDTKLGVAIVNNPAAAQAVELANELLATE